MCSVPISAVVQDSRGNSFQRLDDPRINDLVTHAHAATMPMLGWVDEYGDTIFNVVQMELVVAELERIRDTGPGELTEVAVQLLAMTDFVKSTPHQFLVLLGD
jgi:hypothetical protein